MRLTSGKLITFEGIDGCGKSTQAKRAYNYLNGKQIKCELYREPGGTDVGEAIRKILLASAAEGLAMDGYTEYLLFASSRAELSRTIVTPLLENGCTVLLDRFGDSSTAYQGYGHGVDVDFIIETNRIASGGLKPDLTILLDIDPETALARLGSQNDRIEKRGIVFFKRVRSGFLTLADREPERFRVIDAERSVEDISRDVIELIENIPIK